MGFYQFERKQLIRTTVDELWDFIADPANLKKITPVSMGFDIISGSLPPKMYPGMIIQYKVKPMGGITVKWVTEITQVVEKRYFIDVQQSGPYAFWHHQHLLEPVPDGVLMTDIVSYKPPFGILGSLANALFIRKKLKGIFDYREQILAMRF
jgi:ligand-binding SRPBCC domain-containing protein